MTNSGPTITQKPVEHKRLSDLLLDESGLTITEYAIAAGLIAAAIAGSFGVLGTTIDAMIVGLTVSL
jgi:Flp pilus assembly pilin Flp